MFKSQVVVMSSREALKEAQFCQDANMQVHVRVQCFAQHCHHGFRPLVVQSCVGWTGGEGDHGSLWIGTASEAMCSHIVYIHVHMQAWSSFDKNTRQKGSAASKKASTKPQALTQEPLCQ